MNMEFIRKLPIPMDIKAEYPITEAMAQAKQDRDREIRRIFCGESEKLVLVIGPCSADTEEPVLEYLHRLRRLQDELEDKLLIIPRVYTGKPRTTGEGYKGMIHQPIPSQKPDMLKGIVTMRELHMRALKETGFSCADEMLYPENLRYLNDLLSYVTVGARSVEDQHHRMTASGLSVPVGMKNPTGGDLAVMMNSVEAGRHAHDFIYRGWEVHSQGNPLTHAVLRGYVDRQGTMFPNYHEDDLSAVAALFEERGLEYPAVLVDTSHANSGKDFRQQPRIAKEVLRSRRNNGAVRRTVKGLMIESYLEDGSQPVGGGRFGCSITDPCLGWEKTETLLRELAEMV